MQLPACIHKSNHCLDSSAFTLALLKSSDPFESFLPLLKQAPASDEPLPLLAGLVLTKLVAKAVTSSSKPSPKLESAIKSLYSYLGVLASSSDVANQDIAVQSYSAILRSAKTRQLFWEQRTETVGPLMKILRTGAGAGKDSSSSLWSEGTATSRTYEGVAGGVGIELLYRVLLVIWQLSFEAELVGEGLQE
jgi:V-type H+-transporting ATPase subunit H